MTFQSKVKSKTSTVTCFWVIEFQISNLSCVKFNTDTVNGKSRVLKQNFCDIELVFHLSSLSGPTSQFLHGILEFSERVLVRKALLMDQSLSVLPFQSTKLSVGIWRVVVEKYMHAPAEPFHLNWPELVLFGWPEQF